ncbi:MAG: hypothetical protein AB7I19_17775 [Planctomycetota bacterium]
MTGLPSARTPISALALGLCLAMPFVLSACGEQPVAPSPRAPTPPPIAWFSRFGDEDSRLAFLAEVQRWFAGRKLIAELAVDGALDVRGDRGGSQLFELEALAEIAAKTPRAEWPALIAAQFELVIAIRDATADITVPDWETAQAALRLRLVPESFLADAGLPIESVAGVREIDGLITLAFFDREETALVVSEIMLARWKQPTVVVLGVALSNTREELAKELRIDTKDIGELGKLHALTSTSYYGAAAVLWLDRFPELLGKHGAIVAMPTREGLFVWPFDDGRVARVIPALHALAQRAPAELGSALDPGVFWRRPDGRIERIAIAVVDGKLEITPSADLAELLPK